MPGKRQRTEAPSKRARKPDTPSESSGSGSEEEYGSDVEGGNDQYLHSDSEEDEFEGLATYEVDDWDGAEDDEESGTGSGSDDGDEAVLLFLSLSRAHHVTWPNPALKRTREIVYDFVGLLVWNSS